ncbi:HEPN domain-containing protein [Pantoea septica]|uniref:HEPN domain-containing protein n=1 Tax=Pantoea TaxID=53335 RepID=UPI002FD91518
MASLSKIEIEILRSCDITKSSELFINFFYRTVELEKKFIDESVILLALSSEDYDQDPTNIFDQDLLRAFRLLCHSETEHLLENLADKLSDEEYKSWKLNGIPSDIVVNIVACHYSGWDKLDCSVKEYKPFTDNQLKKHDGQVTMAATEKAYSAYKYSLLKNHGVKEDNFRSMFIPLGISEKNHQTLMQQLENFGGLRGMVAHTGNAVNTPINPIDEKKLIIDIVKGIYLLDKEIDARLKEQGRAMIARINEMQNTLSQLQQSQPQ